MSAFRKYVESLPISAQRAIRAAERAYLNARRTEYAPEGGPGNPLTQAFEESMCGYVETPPGPHTHEQLDKLSEM